jgi:hypothetical protein
MFTNTSMSITSESVPTGDKIHQMLMQTPGKKMFSPVFCRHPFYTNIYKAVAEVQVQDSKVLVVNPLTVKAETVMVNNIKLLNNGKIFYKCSAPTEKNKAVVVKVKHFLKFPDKGDTVMAYEKYQDAVDILNNDKTSV